MEYFQKKINVYRNEIFYYNLTFQPHNEDFYKMKVLSLIHSRYII